jgi:hypothetical protein
MNTAHQRLSWTLLLLLAVVGAAAALLAVTEAPAQPQANLVAAATNTVKATSYTEDYTQVIVQNGTTTQSTFHLVYQAPDRAAGYEQSNGQRSYLVVIGTTWYRGIPVAQNAPFRTVRFYRATTVDWATQDYVQTNVGFVVDAPPANKKIVKKGSAYTFPALTQSGGIATLTYWVDGPYVSQFRALLAGESVYLGISRVNSSPPVTIPSLRDLVPAPTSSQPSS